jgi:DNA-binding MarR family transcriptional regulator
VTEPHPDRPHLDLPDDGLLGAIVRLNLEVGQVLDGIAGASGLSFADYLVLGVVRRSPGRRSAPSAIARLLGRTTGGMSLTLDRLQGAGLLRRSPDAGDGRRVVVELTPAGRALAERVNRQLHGWEADLVLPGSTPEAVAALEALTDAVRANPAVTPAA